MRSDLLTIHPVETGRSVGPMNNLAANGFGNSPYAAPPPPSPYGNSSLAISSYDSGGGGALTAERFRGDENKVNQLFQQAAINIKVRRRLPWLQLRLRARGVWLLAETRGLVVG